MLSEEIIDSVVAILVLLGVVGFVAGMIYFVFWVAIPECQAIGHTYIYCFLDWTLR